MSVYKKNMKSNYELSLPEKNYELEIEMEAGIFFFLVKG